jgi:galactokinase/mevalonate kinase-like predicted kinase
MNIWVFDTLELCRMRFTTAESDDLDMVEKVKTVRVPQDLRPTNMDDCEGELVITFTGYQRHSIDIKLKQLLKKKQHS